MALRTRTRLTAIALISAVALAFVGVAVGRADPTPALPPVGAADLIGSSMRALAGPFSVSGDVQTKVDLGLPELPSRLGGADGPVASLIGTQRYKVWRSPDGVRVAHLFDFAEQTLIANRTQAWWWDSAGMRATRIVYADVAAAMQAAGEPSWLTAIASGSGAGGTMNGSASMPAGLASLGDPTALAARALDALAPYAGVTVDGTARVAGRPVYELVLTPRTPLTLVGAAVVAVDAETRLPLRVQVFAKGAQDPAIEAGFTSVSFDPIDPATFDFTPPPGATVRTAQPPTAQAPATGERPRPAVRTFGSGFDARVAVRVDGTLPPQAAALLPYAGPLASVLPVERDGHTWVLFGLVGIDALRADAAGLA